MDSDASSGESKSSMQYMIVGTVLSVDKYKNLIMIRDRYDKVKSLYVEPSDMLPLKKGTIVQAAVQPGSDRADSVKQIM